MLSFKEDNKKFNFRVGAVIISQDKKRVLLHTIEGYGFYLLPGGRVNLMESSEEAIKRELEEELGLENIQPKIIANVENYFTFKDVDFHEVANNFVIYLTKEHASLEKHDKFFGKEGEKYIFEWKSLEDINKCNLRPALLKKIILSHDSDFKYYALKEK